MKVDTYNQNGKKIGHTLLPEDIFEVKMNQDLVHQVMVSQRANKRQGTAHAKDRSEVSGGGRKPWRQKGTGRARHGSIRSPIWKGGGVTFGPRKEKVYKKTIPKKMRRKALFMVLSAKAKDNMLLVLDKIKIEEAKTKMMTQIIENLKTCLPAGREKIKYFEGKSILIALAQMDKDIILASRNIPKIKTIQVKDLNVLDLLNYKYLIMPKETIEILKTTFLKNF